MASPRVNPRARRRARRVLLQALYAWQLTGATNAELRAQFAFAGRSAKSGAAKQAPAPCSPSGSLIARAGSLVAPKPSAPSPERPETPAPSPGLVDERLLAGADETFFAECLAGVLHQCEDVDALFTPYLDRAIDALDHVERAILRAGTFELRSRPDVPARVAIDEWVELAKGFGAEESFRYVNGVLDRVAHDLRGAELAPP